MKRFYACIIYLVVIASVFAQAPQKMSYQAVIRNNNKVLITNKKVSMIISILQSKTPVYVEMHTAITNDNGLVSLEIGNGVVLTGTFAGIDWSKGSHYIKTETDPTGGSDYSVVGESELLSVPYALYAGNTSSTGGVQGPMGPAGPAGPMGPAGPAGSVGVGGKTNLAELMSGDVTMDSLGVSTISKNAVSSLKIADGSIGNVDLDKSNISLSGFGMPTANISMGGFKLTNLAAPVNVKDAVNKKYVDDALLAGVSPVMSLDANQNLSIKGGNSVSLADLYQSLSLAGTVLSISGPRDSHVDLAGILVGLGGAGSGSSVVAHDGTLTGTGGAATPLSVSNQGITPLKLAGISTNGTSGQVLTTNGGGSFAWADPSSGSGNGLTLVTASQGLSTTTPTPGTVNIGVNDGALVLSKLAPIASGTIIGNNSGSFNYPTAIPATTLKSMLALTKVDVGLTNVKDVDQTNATNLTSGAIPAGRFASATVPVNAIIGNGDATTYLRGDGTWGAPVTGGSSVASGISTTAISGVTGTNVQTVLEGFKTLIDVNTTSLTSKMTGNTAITGATKTKITYDAKGLVTAGADATTADIASTLDKRYVTDAQLASLGSLSGTNTGDQSATTVPVTPTGSLVSPNVQSALVELQGEIDVNSTGLATKLTANTAITGDTKTKITYDSKGLVTVGADATTADIASTLDKRYVTDAQLVSLGSLSGNNTGDQSATTVPVTPTGSLVSTNVQAALVELQGKITTAASGGMVGVNHDATLSGDGNSSNLTIADGGVSLAKMSNLTAKTLIGNSSPFAAKPEAITIGSGLTLSSGVLSAGGAAAGATGGDVVLAGQNYLSLSGQTITANPIDLSGTNATGTLAAARFPSLTGDVTTTAGSLVTTLASTGVTPGLYTSVNVDAKGRIISGVNNTTLGAGLTDVDVSTKAPGEVLQWDGSKWVNKPASTGNQSITFTATGDVTGTTTGTTSLTPTLTIGAGKVTNAMLATGIDAAKLTGTLPLSTIPTTLTGITSVNGMSISTTPTFSLSDGTKTLTVAGNTAVSGTNTGDQTAATVDLNPAISGITGTTVQGALTDIAGKLTQNTTDIAKKLDANSAITASSSFSLANYDAKGLVTGGKIPTTDDVSDVASATRKYVTPAQLTILGNTTGTNTGDQTLSVTAGGQLKISGATGNSVDVVTSLTAGSGLTRSGATGNVTLSLGTNAIKVENLQGSSGALATANATSVLRSNADGTFSWLDIASGSLPVDPSSITLAEKMFFIGNASNKASEIAKSAIPLSGFALPTDAINMGGKQINNLATPTADNDAVTKKYVDDLSTGAVVYQDTYDATTGYIGTGTTSLGPANANKGNYYVVKTAGSAPGFALAIGDWVISNGVEWSKVANSQVAYTTATVPESGIYKYYTDARANEKENVINKTGSITTETDDTKYPSVKAVKSYVDEKVPTSLAADNGKVLTVNSSGNTTWQAITGGGTVKTISVVDNSNGITGTVTADPVNPAISLALGTLKPTAITTTGAISGGAITGTSVIATGTVSGSNLSGTNTGDQTITLTGDVTGFGTGTFATAISDNAITSAKIASKTVNFSDIADATITPAQINIAGTASVGAVPTYNASGGFTWGTGGGTNLTNTPSATNVTIGSSSGSSTTVPAATTTNAGVMLASDKVKLDGLSALSIASATTLGGVKVGTGLVIDGTGVLSASNTGTITSVTATAADGLSGGTVASGPVTIGITNAGIPLTKLKEVATGTLLGNDAASASPKALTTAQVKTMLGYIDNTALNTWTGSTNITTVGTIGAGTWNGGVIPIAYGGTGASTATAAITALLPAQSGNSGRVLQTNGTTASWANVGGGDMLLGTAQSVTALKTFNNSMLAIKGSSTGVTTLTSANTTANPYTISLPAETGTVAMRSTSLSQFAPTSSAELASLISDEEGSGKLVFNTSPTFITPILGVASATSVTATGTLTGSQLISTVAPGTAPLVVTSTTPVTNLSIGGNAATATTATTATNLAGGVAGDIFYQSAPNTTAKLNKGTAGQVLTMNPGATAPIWAAAAGGGSVSAFNYAYTATNPTAALSITATGGPYIATVPVLIDGSTADAGLMIKADKTKLTNFPTISGSPTTNGQVLTYNGSTANWVQPSLQYSGTTGAGTVSINNGGTSATIPVVTTAVSGLMVPADKTKLDKLPTVTNAPVSTAGQVLTSNADGTATWAAATGGSGGGGSYYLALDASTSTPVPGMIIKGSGSKVKYAENTSGTYGPTITLTIPADAVMDYARINFSSSSSMLAAVHTQSSLVIEINCVGGVWNQNAATMLLPHFFFSIAGDSAGEPSDSNPYIYQMGASGSRSILLCSGGLLRMYINDASFVTTTSKYGFATTLIF